MSRSKKSVTPPTSRGVTKSSAGSDGGCGVEPKFDGAVVRAGIDWYTATSKLDEVGFDWFDKYRHYSERTEEGKRMKEIECSTFSYKGVRRGGFAWFYSVEQGYMVVCSSAVAEAYWRDMIVPKAKVTRLDLAVTVEMPRPVKKLARKHMEMLVKEGLVARPGKRLVTDSFGGSTLYVGSRASDQFGRLYDKSVEMGEAEGMIWRYEIEFKKPRSSVVAEQVVDASRAHQPVERLIRNTVYQWFLNRAVRPLFGPRGETLKCDVQMEETSVDRKLRWMRAQVRPTMDWLVKSGHQEELEKAIGYQLDLITVDE